MFIKSYDLIGTPVTLPDKNEPLDTVKDVVLNPQNRQISALVLNNGDLLGSEVVPFGSINALDPHKVEVKSAKDLKPAAKVFKKQKFNGGSALSGKPIVDIEGNRLGRITDVYFETASGQVKAFEVSQKIDEHLSNLQSVLAQKIDNLDEPVLVADPKVSKDQPTEDSQEVHSETIFSDLKETVKVGLDQLKNTNLKDELK